MEDIRTVEDLIQFILQADEIERDGGGGSDIVIPIHDISPEEFLDFAENAIASESKEGMINAISNLKRALDCEMDMFFESISLKSIFDKKNLKFEKKTQFLAEIGLFPIRTINKLNSMRNKMEHDKKKGIFRFDLRDWTKGHEREEVQLVVGLKNQNDVHDFIKVFSLYLLSIQYHDYGNEKLYKEKIKKLKEKEII
ncbi:hypothetical protein H6B11_17400 [Mediterraneibacter glycyrrhizinilyticus]|nr:hypothetical protein [Mediterraneibacter glycyrrhizinilyticus]MBM6855873.1 hypothetical protein [Mediterraneibacter glycyrrhizinilyticus]